MPRRLAIIDPDAAPEFFPPVDSAWDMPNGLLAAGGDLSPERLLYAYRHGIFPWYSPGEPILWWSPDPRMVLDPAKLSTSRSLKKSMRNRGYDIRHDTAFATVMQACAAPRASQDGTWITSEMQDAYGELHRLGHAHSVEVWRDDQLLGGLYGVAVGQVFCGESMFSLATDASKVALVALCNMGYRLIDGQVESEHLGSLGFGLVERREYLRRLTRWRDGNRVAEPF